MLSCFWFEIRVGTDFNGELNTNPGVGKRLLLFENSCIGSRANRPRIRIRHGRKIPRLLGILFCFWSHVRHSLHEFWDFGKTISIDEFTFEEQSKVYTECISGFHSRRGNFFSIVSLALLLAPSLLGIQLSMHNIYCALFVASLPTWVRGRCNNRVVSYFFPKFTPTPLSRAMHLWMVPKQWRRLRSQHGGSLIHRKDLVHTEPWIERKIPQGIHLGGLSITRVVKKKTERWSGVFYWHVREAEEQMSIIVNMFQDVESFWRMYWSGTAIASNKLTGRNNSVHQLGCRWLGRMS